ncbi:MAG: hypothetical protein H7196_01525 [candidate division SR1 bacterium]|nr:hypothetical protein [candidate division SR1 bacterium]
MDHFGFSPKQSNTNSKKLIETEKLNKVGTPFRVYYMVLHKIENNARAVNNLENNSDLKTKLRKLVFSIERRSAELEDKK